ncbi:MAG: signal peptidase I [Actinomycetes bacterium]|jgi:signal peptidase I
MFDDNSADKPAELEPQQPEESGPGFWASLREFVVIIVVAVGLTAFLHNFVVQSNYVPSPSMSDTLEVNDKLLVSRLSTEVNGVRRGEIVVFADPGGWVSGVGKPQGLSAIWHNALVWMHLADSRNQLVKRVIGLPGDHVKCCDGAGRIIVNGVSLNEPYIKGPNSDQLAFDILVPKGHIFVMGDNRGDSRDSRYHLDVADGGVPIDNVIGRVVMRIWPLARIARLELPSSFDAVKSRKVDDVPAKAPVVTSTAQPHNMPYIPPGNP